MLLAGSSVSPNIIQQSTPTAFSCTLMDHWPGGGKFEDRLQDAVLHSRTTTETKGGGGGQGASPLTYDHYPSRWTI